LKEKDYEKLLFSAAWPHFWRRLPFASLQVGARAPDFAARCLHGPANSSNSALADAMKKGPVVLYFYSQPPSRRLHDEAPSNFRPTRCRIFESWAPP